MIDCSTVGKSVDDGLRMIMLNLKACEGNLLSAIQEQIKDDTLLEICLKVNDDLNQTSERYNLLKSGAQPPNFISAFGWSTKKQSKKNKKASQNFNQEPVEIKKEKVQDKQQISSITDIFDFLGSSSTNNQPETEVKSQPKSNTNVLDINDLISSFANTNVNNEQPSNNNSNNIFNSQPIYNFSNQNNNNNKKDELFGSGFQNNNLNQPKTFDNNFIQGGINQNNFNSMGNNQYNYQYNNMNVPPQMGFNYNNLGYNMGGNLNNMNMNNMNNFNNINNMNVNKVNTGQQNNFGFDLGNEKKKENKLDGINPFA